MVMQIIGLTNNRAKATFYRHANTVEWILKSCGRFPNIFYRLSSHTVGLVMSDNASIP